MTSREDNEEVLRKFKATIEGTLGDDPRACFDLAHAYREMGLLSDALEMIEKVLALEPSWPNAAFVRAELIEQLRR